MQSVLVIILQNELPLKLIFVKRFFVIILAAMGYRLSGFIAEIIQKSYFSVSVSAVK